MLQNDLKFSPNVVLLGAGPGDPGLITRVGLQRLQQADVIVFDALANPLLLSEARPDAELIDVGKRAKAHRLTQDQTNALLVEKAREGKRVVRLKGGDPYLFGRGAEEATYLAEHGVRCEIIPGVTAGIAAPAYAGIPVTHRKIASTVTFVTGHEDPTKPETQVDYHALANLIAAGGTVCFYMGVGRLQLICDQLTHFGLPPTTPAAVIQWGTLPRQRVVRSNLDQLQTQVNIAGLGSPAIIVVGEVAGIEEPGLDFFTRRPLFGQCVVVTRTRHQASDLARRLTDLGADVLQAPTIQLVPPASWAKADAALRDLDSYNWLILTSTNGVDALTQRVHAMGLDARHFAGVQLAVIGDATAQALHQQLGLRAEVVSDRSVAESLAEQLIAHQDMAGQRVLLWRADLARPTLPQLLTKAGAHVHDQVSYQTQPVDALPDAVLEALRDGRVDWITFTSASTARNMVALLGDDPSQLDAVKIASIGPITSAAVKELGLTLTAQAASASVESLAQSITQAVCPSR